MITTINLLLALTNIFYSQGEVSYNRTFQYDNTGFGMRYVDHTGVVLYVSVLCASLPNHPALFSACPLHPQTISAYQIDLWYARDIQVADIQHLRQCLLESLRHELKPTARFPPDATVTIDIIETSSHRATLFMSVPFNWEAGHMSGNKVANHPTLLDSRMLELAEAPHPQHKQHYFEHLAYLRFLEAKLNILKSKITLDRPTVEQAYRFFNIPSTASYHLFMKALWFQHHHDHGTSWVNNMPQWLEPLKADMLNQRCMTYSHPMPNIDIKAEDPHEVVMKKLFEHINKWMADHRDAQIAHKYLSDIRKVSTSISTASTSEAVTPTKSRYVVFSFLVPVLYDPTAAPKHPFIELGADCYGHVKVESIDVQGGYRHVDIYISEYYWTGFGANNWDSAHTVRLNHLGFVKDVDSFYNEQPEVKRQIQMIQQTKERIEAFTT